MNFELCTDSVDGAIIAGAYGFKSVELCSALSVGGLTPNYGLIKQCVDRSDAEVHVMIRHKEGAFQVAQDDLILMGLDIHAAKRAGAHGVVFGILDKDDMVSDHNIELLAIAKSLDLKTTFHRAFDFVPDVDEAITKIINFGFDRLLTSGSASLAEEGLDVIQKLEFDYGDKIQIIAGSGVKESNALKFANAGIKYLHFTARKRTGKSVELGMGQFMLTDKQKIQSILNLSF